MKYLQVLISSELRTQALAYSITCVALKSRFGRNPASRVGC
jgi:hypothetical protein